MVPQTPPEITGTRLPHRPPRWFGHPSDPSRRSARHRLRNGVFIRDPGHQRPALPAGGARSARIRLPHRRRAFAEGTDRRRAQTSAARVRTHGRRLSAAAARSADNGRARFTLPPAAARNCGSASAPHLRRPKRWPPVSRSSTRNFPIRPTPPSPCCRTPSPTNTLHCFASIEKHGK